MDIVPKLLCRHEYERQSVYVDTGELVKKCRKCGDRIREETVTAANSATETDTRRRC